MMNAPIVAVRAEATRAVEPEIAQFLVTVTASDRDRTATLSRLVERVEALRAVLAPYAAAIEKQETSRLSVTARSKREKVIAYVGRATTTVVLRDLDVVGEIMLRVADQDQVTVTGPHWSLRPGSPVYREVRQAAIVEVVARAREYADALGARVTGLVELTDTGMSGGAVPAALRFAGHQARDSVASPELDLDPQAQHVSATVEARFSISEPGALAEPLD